jgi:hypothetical protein
MPVQERDIFSFENADRSVVYRMTTAMCCTNTELQPATLDGHVCMRVSKKQKSEPLVASFCYPSLGGLN